MFAYKNITQKISDVDELTNFIVEVINLGERDMEFMKYTGVILQLEGFNYNVDHKELNGFFAQIDYLLGLHFMIAGLDTNHIIQSRYMSEEQLSLLTGKIISVLLSDKHGSLDFFEDIMPVLEKLRNLKEISIADFTEQSSRYFIEVISRLKSFHYLEKIDLTNLRVYSTEMLDKLYTGLAEVVGVTNKIIELKLPTIDSALTGWNAIIHAKIFKKIRDNRVDVLEQQYQNYEKIAHDMRDIVEIYSKFPEKSENKFLDLAYSNAIYEEQLSKELLISLLDKEQKLGEVRVKYYLAKLQESTDIVGAYNLLDMIPENSDYYQKASHMKAILLFDADRGQYIESDPEKRFEEIIRLLLIAEQKNDLLPYVIHQYINGSDHFPDEASHLLADSILDKGASKAIGLLRWHKQQFQISNAEKIAIGQQNLFLLESSNRDNIMTEVLSQRLDIFLAFHGFMSRNFSQKSFDATTYTLKSDDVPKYKP